MTTTDAAPVKAPGRWPYVVTFLLMADVGAALAWMRFRKSDALGSTEAWAGAVAAVAGLAAGWLLGRALWRRVLEEARARAADPNAFAKEPTFRQAARMFGTYFAVHVSLTLASNGPDVLAAAVMIGLCAGCLGVAFSVLVYRPS
ncbi:MAG TPA: hypothetical protein VNQ77_14060 [Frankiaceae bacterium]|nr:hypothetical protein [Frankiaceae bacterium]